MPVHVTMRGLARIPNLRSERLTNIVREEIRRVSVKGVRVVHFSVQTKHLHLLVEAERGHAMSRGMQRLASRISRRVNMAVGRRGQLWRERYHREDLGSPRQVRNALVYILFNARKHASNEARYHLVRRRELDPCSSAAWLDAWDAPPQELAHIAAARAGPCPVVAPRTFLASRGWLRHGRLRLDATPRS